MTLELILDIAQLALTIGTLIAVFIRLGPAKHARRREEIATMAVDYAEQMGGALADRLKHAIGAAQRIDLADNGKRDFSDAELRIAIEAVVGRRNAQNKGSQT